MLDSALRPVMGCSMLLMLGFFLFLALRQSKNVQSLFQYHLYGNDLKPNRFAGSLISTNASLSGAFVLILYYGFLYGPWAFAPVALFWVITQLTSAWTIQKTQFVLENYGGWYNNRATLHEFLGMAFASPKARRYAGILSLLSYLGLIAAEIVLATYVLTYLLPDNTKIPFTRLPAGPFMVIVAIMFSILIYNVLSGFRGTVQTDYAQWIIMSIMIFIVLVFVIVKWPVWTTQYSAIFNTPSKSVLAAWLNPDGHGFKWYASFLGSNFIFWGFWWPGAMDQWQRCAAARTPKMSLQPWWGTIGVIPTAYFALLTFVFLMAGVWLRVNAPDAQPDPTMLSTLIQHIQTWSTSSLGHAVGIMICALTFLGLICAAMSTLDSYIMTASQTFFVDIVHYKKGYTLVDLTAADENKKLLTQARAFTIFIPLLVILMALLFSLASDVYALIYFSFSFMFALLPPLYIALKGRGHAAAHTACERSLIAGGVTSLGYVLILIPLERALRANDATGANYWYQFVYWWPAVIAVVGGIVLWLNWQKQPKEQRQEERKAEMAR